MKACGRLSLIIYIRSKIFILGDLEYTAAVAAKGLCAHNCNCNCNCSYTKYPLGAQDSTHTWLWHDNTATVKSYLVMYRQCT